MPINQNTFDAALDRYVDGCKHIYAAYQVKQGYTNQTPAWEVQRLQKRVRIVQGGSAHSFVDLATGDVFLPASWKTPSKHARGNIFDPHNGLADMGPYGPKYLR